MSGREIRFVYFDLGNVLVTFDPEEACANVARRFDVSIDRARQAIYHSGLQDRFEHGHVSPADYCDQLRGELNAGPKRASDQDVLDAISEMFTPVERMAEVLTHVRQRGLPLGILSNTCVAHWQWISRQNYPLMAGRFEVQILSCDVGSMKPDDGIYRAAEEAAGVPGEHLLFLDDRSENVAAARGRGWNAEKCLGAKQVVAALCRHGVMTEEEGLAVFSTALPGDESGRGLAP